MAIVIPIGVDTSGLSRGLSQGTSGLRKFGKMAAIVGGAAALGGLVATLKIGVDEFMGAQKVLAQTGAVLKSTGGAANVTSKQITTMSESLMKLSGVDDEAIQSGQNLLLTFTKIRNETGKGNNIFDQATLAMTNLSVAMGKDLSSSAILVGKALNDPVKGVGALSRAGVQFTASQKDTIKALVDSGNVMGAQKMILKELETQFGGSAKAAGQTLPGQLNILKETFRNTAAELVTVFIPYLSRATRSLLDFVREFSAQPTFRGKVSFVIEKLKDAAGNAFTNLYDWWNKSKTSVNTTGTITFRLAGREQFDKFFTGLEADSQEAGRRLVRFLLGAFTREGRKEVGPALSSIFGQAFEGLKLYFRISGTSLAANLILGIIYEIDSSVESLANSLVNMLKRSVGVAANRRLYKPLFDIIIVNPIQEAIKTARASLSGLGSEVAGFLERVGAAGGKSKEAAGIRARLKSEADAREKARLTEAVAMAATDDDRATATRELNDYIANENADRLDAEAKADQDKNQQDIQNLIQKFNEGTKNAEQFAAELNAIIGQDFGDSLGIAFVAGFKGALANLITEVQGIATGSITGEQATAGSTVAGAQSDVAIAARDADRARKEAAYQTRLQAWKDRREKFRTSLQEKYRKEGSLSGSTITPAERKLIEDGMVTWNKNNKEPIRMAAGGILKRQVFTAGEAGREAVIPLGSSEAMGIMRDALGGGRGGTTYNLVINAGLGTNPDELGRTIVESIKKFEKRNGQVFAGPQIQATSAGVSTNGGTQTRNLRKN